MNNVKKVAIILGYECNNNCRFCYAGHKRQKFESISTKKAKKRIKEGKERGGQFLDLLGGEPTIRKDIIGLVKYARKLGYHDVSITTNGRMLSYEEFTRKIVKAGLNHAIFSVHGHNSSLHNYLTRGKNSFQEAIKGIENMRKVERELGKDIYICTNTVMVKPNLEYLYKIAENNYSLDVDGMEFIFPHPKGKAWDNFEEMVPTLKEIEPYVIKLIETGKNLEISHFVLRYLPLCYMNGAYEFASELISGLEEEHVGPEFEDLNVEENRKVYGKIKGPQCKKCSISDKCEGIWKEYAEKRGTEELNPV